MKIRNFAFGKKDKEMKLRFICIMAAFLFCISCNSQNNVVIISPQEYATAIDSDTSAIVLDVRQKAEYEKGHLQNAIQLNFLDKAEFEKGLQSLDKTKTYYIYCRSGRRSNQAAIRMQEKGFKVFDMRGGIIAWEKAGFTIIK